MHLQIADFTAPGLRVADIVRQFLLQEADGVVQQHIGALCVPGVQHHPARHAGIKGRVGDGFTPFFRIKEFGPVAFEGATRCWGIVALGMQVALDGVEHGQGSHAFAKPGEQFQGRCRVALAHL